MNLGLFKRRPQSVFNPVEQRLYGLVTIAEGLAQLVLGKYAPVWTYKVALWGAKRAHDRRADR